MVRRKIEKTTGLLISVFSLIASLIYIPEWTMVGVSVGCGFFQRFAYSLFHASILHAIINAWCILSIIFLYDVKGWQLIVSYLIAVAAPDFALSVTPTVGLSAVCFALLGMIVFQVKRKIFYNACMAAYISVGFLFTQVNGWLHLYSYIAGLLVGFLNMPIPCKRK